jgi:hypothetical protein
MEHPHLRSDIRIRDMMAEDVDRLVFVNQDGTRGVHWNYEAFKAAVESLGAKMTDEPFFNCWALWVTANMLYSDHHKSTMEFVPKDQDPRFFYTMAVEKLKDIDHPKFIRHYFGL